MRKYFSPTKLPIFAAGAGLLGMLLRFWLLADGIDRDGLLICTHPANIIGWILTALAVGLIFFGTRRLLSAAKYEFNFPASGIGGIAIALGALGILVCAITTLGSKQDALALACGILGLICAIILGYTAWCRWKGKRYSVVFHGMVCLFFMIFLLCRYRSWSANPQLQDYCFQLLGGVCLLIGTYHRTCFDGNTGNRRSLSLFRLLAVYFCLLAIPGTKDWFFYLTGALWSLGDLCSLVPMPSHRPRG